MIERCSQNSVNVHTKLLTFLKEVVGLQEGVSGVVMGIHTFGASPERWPPHLHALATDGFFKDKGTFYVMKNVDLKPLEDLFRAEVFKMLKKAGKINDELINKLLGWKHSGFSVNNGVPIKKEDKDGREAVAQYLMYNVFNVENVTYIEKTGKVIYHCKMQKGKNKKNFMVYTGEEFIAAITQHIPKKSFQMSRHYGFYSNKSRGMRAKVEQMGIEDPDKEIFVEHGKIIDVSKYQPKKVLSLTW